MRKFSMTMCLLSLFTLMASHAIAATPNTFIVLPFAVQGSAEFNNLEQAIPQMLTSRLYWKDHTEPKEVATSQKAVSTDQAAEKARAKYKATYAVWGTLTVIGNNYSLDVRVRNSSGKTWSESREGNTNQIISSLSSISDSLNAKVFGRNSTSSKTSAQDKPRVNQMNPGIVVNQDTPKDVYLNPQFRYSGSSNTDDSRMRSQALPYTSLGMEVCDADNDGKNEVFILGDNKLYAYRFSGAKLSPLAKVSLPSSYGRLSLRSIKRPNGKTWLIVNQIDDKLQPSASIFTFDGTKFIEEMSNIRFLLNVVNMPPFYKPTIIGQKTQAPKLFKQGVYEMVMMNGELTTGSRLPLPEAANVMNFTYLPGMIGEDGGDKMVVFNKSEQLTTYSSKGSRLAESDDTFSGSAVGIEISTTMPGLGHDTTTVPSVYYVPMRLLPFDLEKNGRFEILVNKPISTASKIFERYRSYPQSEIQSLFWDGVGLNLKWKTRRIKGSTVDYTIADVSNEGTLSLVVCLNTHPGAIGASSRKTIIVAYPLDTSKMDPNTPVHNSQE